ncbi:DUF624 domain-containing protein [Robertmurraya sp. DFI.2.37]|uniref:YesL family protein n=1 Tax=Robertmurraya sp. DFI.2.37 TaxID=3031819 RepID=UPI001CD9F6BC|nr:DUF624 domain-containing protein [Robertmurraya sp. DFI.2.37]MDF1511143.1 DUF624 domain-containing protein [Robertmurraya sp. DFI.2.37]
MEKGSREIHMNEISSLIYRIFEWITRFAYLQLLWILFSLIGGIILGIFPATVAMFAIIRKWLRGNTEISLFPVFWSFYKNEFHKSNQVGLILYLLIFIIGIDFIYLYENSGQLTWVQAPLFAFMLLSLLFVSYLFPAFVHFELNHFSIMKHAFFMMLVHPLHSLLMLLSLLSLAVIVYYIPAFGFIFGASSSAFITMSLALHAFNKLQKR